jgi:hypothetical protein
MPAEEQREYVVEHDREFLRSSAGRSLCVSFGITVRELEQHLAHQSEDFESFVVANIAYTNRPAFWERYERVRAQWAHPQV